MSAMHKHHYSMSFVAVRNAVASSSHHCWIDGTLHCHDPWACLYVRWRDRQSDIDWSHCGHTDGVHRLVAISEGTILKKRHGHFRSDRALVLVMSVFCYQFLQCYA